MCYYDGYMQLTAGIVCRVVNNNIHQGYIPDHRKAL